MRPAQPSPAGPAAAARPEPDGQSNAVPAPGTSDRCRRHQLWAVPALATLAAAKWEIPRAGDSRAHLALSALLVVLATATGVLAVRRPVPGGRSRAGRGLRPAPFWFILTVTCGFGAAGQFRDAGEGGPHGLVAVLLTVLAVAAAGMGVHRLRPGRDERGGEAPQRASGDKRERR